MLCFCVSECYPIFLIEREGSTGGGGLGGGACTAGVWMEGGGVVAMVLCGRFSSKEGRQEMNGMSGPVREKKWKRFIDGG